MEHNAVNAEIVCRCEDVTAEEIMEAIRNGADSLRRAIARVPQRRGGRAGAALQPPRARSPSLRPGLN